MKCKTTKECCGLKKEKKTENGPFLWQEKWRRFFLRTATASRRLMICLIKHFYCRHFYDAQTQFFLLYTHWNTFRSLHFSLLNLAGKATPSLWRHIWRNFYKSAYFQLFLDFQAIKAWTQCFKRNIDAHKPCPLTHSFHLLPPLRTLPACVH